jgi:hypothetical protein
VRLGKNSEPSEQSEIVDNTGQEHKEVDPTEELVQWAKDRLAAVSESTPGEMMPLGMTGSKAQSELAASESSTGSAEVPDAAKLKPEARVLVLALHEGTNEWGQAHLLSDGEEARRLIEALMDDGLDSSRISVFWGMPVTVKVTYRPVVTIDQPEQDAREAN